MRLSTNPVGGDAWLNVESSVHRELSARLDQRSHAPIAVALSGGGDSVALLLTATAWALGIGRSIVCLTVDHGLSPLSTEWTIACAARARRLGWSHAALHWTEAKPSTGLAAAARAARHARLADAARRAGASVILMGHTADDVLEARAMRALGSTVPEPRAWSPSPAWPEGRGVFLLRPLLDVRRATIRQGLRERRETWLDDPANADPASARARARAEISGNGDVSCSMPPPEAASLFRAARFGWAGEITIDLAHLAAAPAPSLHRFLGAAATCAGGGGATPRGAAVRRLLDRMTARTLGAATLAGARIEFDTDRLSVVRDDGAPRRPWTSRVFDGRYEMGEHLGAKDVVAAGGHFARLDPAHRNALRHISPIARRTVPAIRREDGSLACAVLESCGGVARSLVSSRLAAACGCVETEAAIGRVGETPLGILDRSASIERPRP